MLRLSTLGVVAVAGALGVAGCKDLTEVEAPDVVQPEDYSTAAGASALAAGALTGFQQGFGSFNGLVLLSGLMADELTVTSTTAGESVWDRREFQDPFPDGTTYAQLHDTRQRLLTAIDAFQRAAPDSSARIGQLFALLGYTGVFLGETFCAGVPLGHRDADLGPVYGQSLPTAELFDSALVYGADSARIAHLARLGLGRALLNQGRFGDAALAVADVPTDYAYSVTYLSDFGLHNVLAFVDPFGSPELNYTVPEQEGTNGLNWRTAGDPRVPLLNRTAMDPEVIGNDGVTELWGFLLYEEATAPIPLAGGVEARLIEAEAALQGGDVGSWLTIHNTLRGTVPGLDPITDPGSDGARVDLHFRERAFWLFLTAQRLGDLRRLVRQYGRGAESVFPTGVWREGISYDAASNVAPPASQLNNPHYSGCLNRDA